MESDQRRRMMRGTRERGVQDLIHRVPASTEWVGGVGPGEAYGFTGRDVKGLDVKISDAILSVAKHASQLDDQSPTRVRCGGCSRSKGAISKRKRRKRR